MTLPPVKPRATVTVIDRTLSGGTARKAVPQYRGGTVPRDKLAPVDVEFSNRAKKPITKDTPAPGGTSRRD
jgi:hypothetical protein